MSTSDKVDARFVSGNPPKWKNGQNQKLQGTEFLTIPPSSKSATHYEYELSGLNSAILFGPCSGFRVKGTFEVKASKEALDSTYTLIPEDEYAKVQLMPNWFENLVKSVDVFHNNTQIKCDDVPRYADQFVNTYIYSRMDKEVRDYLFPEPHNPGRCVPLKKGGFSKEADSEWHEYSKTVFNKRAIEFRHTPTHTFPFFQQPEFGAYGSKLPVVIPMSVLEKLTFAINFKESTDCIFKKLGTGPEVLANTKVYRFRIISIDLVVEEARLNVAFEKSLNKRTTPILYQGVTRYGMVENIQAGVLAHRTELPKIDYPEGLFIFALSNKIIGGQFQYQEHPSITGPIFSEHNISSIDITYNGMPLFIKTPNLGHIKDDLVAIRHMMDHKESPPFGIPQDLERLTWESIRDGGVDSDFPHIYLNLCPSKNETRNIAIGDDGKSINNVGEINLHFKFGAGGAKANCTYYIYAFYTDINMVLDMKSKSLHPYYKKVRSSF